MAEKKEINKMRGTLAKVALLFFLISLAACNKNNEHHLSGRFIDAVSKKGMAGEEFQIVEARDHGWLEDSRKVIKTVTTDQEGYFDFGRVKLKNKSNNRYSVGNSSSDWQTDVYKFVGASAIVLNESEHHYDFYVVPAFKRLYLNVNGVSNLSPGDSIIYSLQSDYLKETDAVDAFTVEGAYSYAALPLWLVYYKGPAGKYTVNVRKKIGGNVTYLKDSLSLSKGEERVYEIEF